MSICLLTYTLRRSCIPQIIIKPARLNVKCRCYKILFILISILRAGIWKNAIFLYYFSFCVGL